MSTDSEEPTASSPKTLTSSGSSSWLYTSRGGMRRFPESRIVLQLSGRKQAVILIVTSRKEEHHGLVSRAFD